VGGVKRVILMVATLLVVATASIAFALQVTPEQSVSTLGQTVAVGTTAPTWSVSGPGEVVLFGQSLPTQVEFIGPVRPRLVLTDISINEQVARLFDPSAGPGATNAVGEALAAGWRRYFVWEIAFVALGAVLLLGAIAGWRRFDRRRTLITVVGGLMFVQAVNLSSIMVTATTAPGILRGVESVSGLVGRAASRPVAPAPGPAQPGVRAIVLGDSTAAGLGGPPLPDATPADRACQRSSFAFATTLARVNDWDVRNLACSGATIDQGILGTQIAGGRRIRAQLAEAKRAIDAEVVIVNVGANDMHWSTLVRLCGASDTCDDRALTAFYQRSLDLFTQSYYELLRQLVALPGDPLVIVNQYYAPFDAAASACLAPVGLTPEKIETLLSLLDTLNTVLAEGAATFGYRTARPDFSGHELCSDQSYVQGTTDPAPLHPNARGHLVIAIADERALLGAA
jgi:lysophospholipase L1-like esterase